MDYLVNKLHIMIYMFLHYYLYVFRYQNKKVAYVSMIFFPPVQWQKTERMVALGCLYLSVTLCSLCCSP